MGGQVDIGYEINRQVKLIMRFKSYMTFGGFECSYGRRSQVIYHAHQDCVGYMIRYTRWKVIEQKFPEFYELMKKKFMEFYMLRIRKHIINHKEEEIAKYEKREDHQEV